MDKTKIDQMLINMIQPRVKEIETRFAQGAQLDHDDVNTLLLKSQYNHINHLDQKLDEVTADVASLKDDFKTLGGEFKDLKGEVKDLKGEVNHRFNLLEERIEASDKNTDNRITALEKTNDIRMTAIEKSIAASDKHLDVRITAFEKSNDARLTSLETNLALKVSEAINKNMRWSIALIALLVAALKLTEILVK